MNGYEDFSAFYDRLTTDVDYPARAAYLLSLFERYDTGPLDTVLDLACGSGSLSVELARRGLEVVGVDGSAGMLAKAMQKAENLSCPILFLEQDMRQLDLYGTVSGAVCVLDSLNHLLKTQDLREVFGRLRLFVDPGGLLIFDVNTPYKHRQVLGDNAFVFEEEEFLCVWRNRLVSRTCEVEMLLDFFVPEGDEGTYRRLTDVVRERAYSENTLRKLLLETGWETLAVYEDQTWTPPSAETQRMVFVARNTRSLGEALEGI